MSPLKILVALFLAMVIEGSVDGQDEINYQNKLILKALDNEGIHGYADLEEMSLPDTGWQQMTIQGKFFRTKAEVSQINYIYIGRVNSCRAGGCSNSDHLVPEGNSEYFDYFILFNREMSISMVKVFNYQATHGQEISARGWLKQFEGYDGRHPLLAGKDIDAISGASISVHGITNDISQKTSILRQIASLSTIPADQ